VLNKNLKMAGLYYFMNQVLYPLTEDEYNNIKSSLYHLSDYEKEVISIDNHFEARACGESLGFIETNYIGGDPVRTFNLFNLFGSTLRLFKKEVDRGDYLSDILSGVCLNGSKDSVKEAKKLLEDILGRELDKDYKLPEVKKTGFEIKY